MKRTTRYQGAVIRNYKILFIKHSNYIDGLEYWILPGGGREKGESEEDCVKREMKEETNLDVIVERFLVEITGRADNYYQYYRTYLCKPLTFDAKPGIEPEADVGYKISELGWFNLRDESDWPKYDATLQHAKYVMYNTLKGIRKSLGYNSQTKGKKNKFA